MTSAPASSTGAAPTGALAADDPAVLVGRVIAERYRVEAVLGRGGMGAVLRCHHLGLQRDVAVKLLHPKLADDREIAARFEREAASASRLDHPNCVRVLDFGAWQAVPGAAPAKYLAMQLLEGGELTAQLGKPLPPRRAIALMQQILAGLEHAHAHGIVHRDLKPENVFVTRDHDGDELLKLVDFGIAKITEADSASPKLTRVGFVFGTPQYMSPEQAAGGTVDLRTDLYAAGVILYEMLAGIPPFMGDDPTALLRQHVFDDPPPLSHALPHGLRQVVMRMLAKDRDRRFASAREVREALAEIDAEIAAASSSTARPVFGTIARATTMTPISAVGMPPPAREPSAIARLWWVGAAAVVLGAIALAKLPDGASTPSSADADPPATWLADRLQAWQRGDAPPPVSKAPGAAAVVAADTRPSSLASLLPTPTPTIDRTALDEALGRGDHAAALVQLDALLVLHPDDGSLLLQRARELTAVPSRDDDAMQAWSRALEVDNDALDEPAVLTELVTLLQRPPLRVAATELALTRMGDRALPVLLDFVAAPKPVLEYSLRHRALDRIAADADASSKLDRSLQQSLDLWQAGQAPAPCVAFGAALDEIQAEPSPGVLGTLHRVTPPVAAADADPASAEACGVLPMRLQAVRAQVLAAHPVPATAWTVPPAYAAPKKKAAKKRRGVLQRLFGG
ncbi:MAG: serine/threonine protein kinase [Deltaproteobacteria bacterium]|nr:serine/threonine protein kinase [Deltaproteobacteria bacterium]